MSRFRRGARGARGTPGEEQTAPTPGATPALELSGVHVHREEGPVLHGVSLSLAPGEVLALLGANGSGKSTLLKASLGILPIALGSIRIAGEELGRGVDFSRVGYVPQRHSATAGVPTAVSEVVGAGLLSGRKMRLPRDAKHLVTAALEEAGLVGLARSPVATLSGGLQQRVLIARALVRDPSLCLLDEPATGLDQASQDHLVESLMARRRAGMAAIIVLHEVGPFAPLITKAGIVREHRLWPVDPPLAGHDPTHPLGDPHHVHAKASPSADDAPHLGWGV